MCLFLLWKISLTFHLSTTMIDTESSLIVPYSTRMCYRESGKRDESYNTRKLYTKLYTKLQHHTQQTPTLFHIPKFRPRLFGSTSARKRSAYMISSGQLNALGLKGDNKTKTTRIPFSCKRLMTMRRLE